MVERTPLGKILAEEGRTQSWLAMQVAARLGRPCYKQQVSAWVRGLHVPEPRTREAIASVLDIPVADLFGIHPDTVSMTTKPNRSSASDEEIAA